MIAATRSEFFNVSQQPDPDLAILKGDLQNLLETLAYLSVIFSVTEYTTEYSAELSQTAYFITQIVGELQKVTDPSVLASSAYKKLVDDFTKATTPSLLQAAENRDPKMLAELLLSMKGSSSPLPVTQLEADINNFKRL